MRPLNDTIILRPVEMQEATASGLIRPQSVRRRSNEAVVVAVGPGRYENGQRKPIDLQPDDRVLFLRFGYGLTLGGESFYKVTESEILLVLEDDESADFTGDHIDEHERKELLGAEV